VRAFGRVLGLSKKHLAGEQSSSLARGFPAGLRWCSCRSREVWAGKQTAKPPTKARKLDSRRDFTREAKSRARAEPVFGFGCSRTVHDSHELRSKNRRLVKSVRELAFSYPKNLRLPRFLKPHQQEGVCFSRSNKTRFSVVQSKTGESSPVGKMAQTSRNFPLGKLIWSWRNGGQDTRPALEEASIEHSQPHDAATDT